MKDILQVILAVAMVVVLTACTGAVGPKPGTRIVEQAIVQQLGQTQQELSQQLRLDLEPSAIQVKRVRVTAQTPLLIGELPAFRVQGTYDYTVKLPKRQVTLDKNPFDLYLQRQQEGKTWRLAKRLIGETGEPVWVTQRVKQY